MLFTPVAWADDATGDASASQSDQSSAQQHAETLTIAQSTPVVSASSGFHMQVVVANHSDSDAPAGSLTATINALFTFASRSDMQSWAENGTHIPTPNLLDSVDVPSIKAGGSSTVSFNIPADNQTLSLLRSWGPKPLQLVYVAGDAQAELHSFLTRSTDGLNTAQTPAMNLTVAMPLTSGDWQTNDQAITNIIEETDAPASANGSEKDTDDDANNTGTGSSDTDAGSSSGNSNGSSSGSSTSGSAEDSGSSDSFNGGTGTATTAGSTPLAINAQSLAATRTLEQTAAKHPALQLVADPVYVQQSGSTGTVAGVMQPADFDITSYAAINDPASYGNAGIADNQWSAKTAQTQYAVAAKTAAAPTAYAWQGAANWSMDALTKARAQGYTTVIANASFDNEQTDTVHTGTYVVNTSAGDVTVLKAQSELSTLAQGRATSEAAAAETSDAGRLARLMAQSAFYQMEQPYTSRHLLMTFNRDSTSGWVNQVMSALEGASWLSLTGLDAMAAADPYDVSDSVNQGDGTPDMSATRTILDQLITSRQHILRLGDSILEDSVNATDLSSLDPQALARRDANSTANHDNDQTQWMADLLAVHDDMALRALTGAEPSDAHQRMADAAMNMASTLLNSVSITPSESVSVFSESAKMPITVSNALPYAVSINVNSITDSMQIVTSRTTSLVIPAHSEAQVAFTIRVSTSGSTTAHVSLTDRSGTAFGNVQNTPITSVLRISDASGFIIIGFAVLLGVVGLWRQFNRKKDPDE
ncbi:DUF6049 family protein [Bifidobacterium sp. UTCIF-36]|uniref:DUF6049 family protein n=1 Tax=Bifidobacterium sp. UTCIF-36 TaxID=1465258 RepID=UPI0011272C11|nr:DUF6049 family protein [Bifidobacterium sp. UTCIF-36]TPF83584.1 hypothetical protein BW07_09365 [Bifidobacterium sp. UTCIF-36]